MDNTSVLNVGSASNVRTRVLWSVANMTRLDIDECRRASSEDILNGGTDGFHSLFVRRNSCIARSSLANVINT